MSWGTHVTERYLSSDDGGSFINTVLVGSEPSKKKIGDIEKSVPATNGILVSSFIITSTTMGAGIVSFPDGFKNAGIVGAFFLLGFSCIYSLVCTRMYFWALHELDPEEKAKLASFEDAVEVYFGFTKFFGKLMRKVAELIMFLAMFAPCVIYLCIIGDIMTPVFQEILPPGTIFTDRTFVILLCSCCVVFPFTLLRRLGMLKYTSYVAIITIWYVIFLVPMVAILGIFFGEEGSGIPAVPAKGFTDHIFINTNTFGGIAPNIFMTLPTFSFAFGCQIICTQVYAELKKPKMWKFDCISCISYTIVTVGYTVVGFFGFLSFGSLTDPDILSNYGGGSFLAIPAWIGRAAMGVHCTCVFPTIQMVQRASLNSVFFGGQNTSSLNHVLITTVIFVGNLLIAILVPDITLIFGFLSSVLIVIVCYVYPSLFFLLMIRRKVKGCWCKILWGIVPVLCLMYSVFMMIVGPLTSVFKMRAEG